MRHTKKTPRERRLRVCNLLAKARSATPRSAYYVRTPIQPDLAERTKLRPGRDKCRRAIDPAEFNLCVQGRLFFHPQSPTITWRWSPRGLFRWFAPTRSAVGGGIVVVSAKTGKGQRIHVVWTRPTVKTKRRKDVPNHQRYRFHYGISNMNTQYTDLLSQSTDVHRNRSIGRAGVRRNRQRV